METYHDHKELIGRVRGYMESKYPEAVPIGDWMFFGEECLQKMEGSGRYCYVHVSEERVKDRRHRFLLKLV